MQTLFSQCGNIPELLTELHQVTNYRQPREIESALVPRLE